MNEPPGARLRVGLSGLTMAEYFRDQGQDVLLFIDNIFRFVQAGSEVSALLGRMPSAVGYQPTLATEMGQLQERITSTRTGSVTSVQAIYVPADDLTDPAPGEHVRAPRLDDRARRARSSSRGSTRRSTRSTRPRARCSRASCPTSTTRRATRVQEMLQRYKDLQDIIAILGIDELSDEDKLTVAARAQDPALPLAADLRRRAVHRHAGRVRQARGHDPRLPGDHRGQARRPARSRPSTWSARSSRRCRRLEQLAGEEPEEPRAEASAEEEPEPAASLRRLVGDVQRLARDAGRPCLRGRGRDADRPGRGRRDRRARAARAAGRDR